MRLDKQTTLCNAQAVTTGTQLSENAIDLYGAATAASNQVQGATTDTLGNTVPDDTAKSDAHILVEVVTAFTGGTSLVVNLITSAAANLGSETVITSTPAIAEASLVAGYKFRINIPPVGLTARYLGLQFVTVGTHTAGNITAAVVGDKTAISTSVSTSLAY